MNNAILDFPVVIYGNLEQFNDVVSKARCRVFYKGGNRNGTYITDDFAEQLVASLPYVPVKGIYDELSQDFLDHGRERSEGRIYGIVPETNNFAWEKHIDDDGEEREYACTDVLLFTALYKEAKEITDKTQSMELFAPSLKYHEEIIDGEKWVVFDKGCFLGLQALGDNVEPCFEGAAFYTLVEDTISKIREYAKNYQGGQEKMEVNFKLSDSAKFKKLCCALNPEFNEEGNWTVTYELCDVYDDYALVYNIGKGCYERAYYEKCNETDEVKVCEMKKCFVMDITEEEYAVINALHRLNGCTYEAVSETLEKAEENFEKVSELSSKNEELETANSTLNTEKEDALNSLNEKTEELSNLNAELNSLKEYKHNIETEQKKAVISEYAEQLSEEILAPYNEKLDEFTVVELDKELAYVLKKSNPSVFSKAPGAIEIPKVDEEPSGDSLDAYLARYVRN